LLLSVRDLTHKRTQFNTTFEEAMHEGSSAWFGSENLNANPEKKVKVE
jgi:hypothetical protein